MYNDDDLDYFDFNRYHYNSSFNDKKSVEQSSGWIHDLVRLAICIIVPFLNLGDKWWEWALKIIGFLFTFGVAYKVISISKLFPFRGYPRKYAFDDILDFLFLVPRLDFRDTKFCFRSFHNKSCHDFLAYWNFTVA